MKFRKKPVVVEAVRLNCVKPGDPKLFDCDQVPMWLLSAILSSTAVLSCKEYGTEETFATVSIRTPEGNMLAERGDWIICGVKGELYPCKHDIFEQTYEPAKF